MNDRRRSETDVESPAPKAPATPATPAPAAPAATPATPSEAEAPARGGDASPETAAKVSASRISGYDYSNFYSGTGDDPFNMLDPFEQWWADARPRGYYLFGLPLQTAPRGQVDIVETKDRTHLDGLINLASYNYLGLSYRKEVIEAAVDALRLYGLGASGSPILSGTFDQHERLTEELAAFKKKEAVLLFPTGYSANLGLIAGLMRPGDWVVADQWAHASVVDGIVLSKANTRFFRHNDVDDLEKKLKKCTGKKLVVVEGVYSMDGDIVPLADVVEVCKRHGARILIDEAHSTFVFGQNGRGVAEHFGVEDQVDIHLGTFSKSLGGIGGFVAGPRKLINYLRGFARSHVFSCALPPPIVAGLRKSLEIAIAEPELRTRLWNNVRVLQDALRAQNVDIGDSVSQVVPVMIRDDDKIFAIGEDMVRSGVYLNPIRYPAVGKHRSRFRISVSAAHEPEQLARAATIIGEVLRRHGVCA